jgi:hypothetical protein
MKPFLALVLLAPLAAQDPPAESPVPSTEAWLSGFVEAGYRWRTDVGGNFNSYRSVVDLGEGPKLLSTDFTIQDVKKRLFDRIDARAYNWGDDPYSTLHVNVRKQRVYDFNADYRNIAYFNSLPSFANPLLSQGVLESQRAFDIRNRLSTFQLDLLPGNWIVPYLAYERSSGYGRGVSTFVASANEYAVPTIINYSLNNFRGGVRLELRRAHLTLEQGGTTFRDDQSLFQDSGVPNPGNRTAPYLGQTLFLSGLSQAYGVRGDGIYSKILATAEPVSWIHLYGQFLYSRPENETTYQQFNTGNFAPMNQAAFLTSQRFLLSSAARSPHQSGNAGAEIRVLPRMRVMAGWQTDRIQISGLSLQESSSISSALRNTYNHLEFDVLFDLTSKLTLRGGYRYVWGDSSSFVLPASGLIGPESVSLKRNIAKGGFSYRPLSQFVITGDYEGAGTDKAYFRTSLYSYDRGKLRGSYQISPTLALAAEFSALSNQNPTPNINYDYFAMQTSASVVWSPKAAGPLSVQAGYTRSTIRSDIQYLAPQFLLPERSFYRDNAHTIHVGADWTPPAYHGMTPKISAGGMFFLSSGSRPTNYFQPLSRVMIPFYKGLDWVSEWTYHGYGEAFYVYEGFRTHLITTGIRITK